MRLVINVRTPTFVLSGSRLYMGLDAVIIGNALHVIDIGRLPMDQLLRIKSMEINQALNTIASLVSSDPGNYTLRRYDVISRCDANEVLDHNPEGIPPSEVKGFIRTAYLYRLLTMNEELRRSFFKNVSEGIASGSRLNALSTWAEDDALSIGVTWLEYGGTAIYKLFKDLAVRQVSRPQPRDYGVYCIQDRSNKFRAMAIGLRPGTRLEYDIAIRHAPTTESVRDKLLNFNDIAEAIRLFSSDVTSFEASRGLSAPNCGGGVPVRLGFGVGRRWKTVINLIERYDRELAGKVVDYVSRRLNRPWGDATIRLANNEPVGWACIEVVP